MRLSLFSNLDDYKLIKILSYQTTEDLCKYSRHADKRWQKAATIELCSRHHSREDILNQINFFQKKVIPYFKKDDKFVKELRCQIISSMHSAFSTPIHKLHSAFFLCHFCEIADGVMSDELMMFFMEMFSIRKNDYPDDCCFNDTYHHGAAFAAVLSQTQIDRIVTSMTLKLKDGSEEAEMALQALLLLAPRIHFNQIKCFITIITQRLNALPNWSELSVLKVFLLKLTLEQIDTVIANMLVKLDSEVCDMDHVLNHLMSFASVANSTHAYNVFTKLIPRLHIPTYHPVELINLTLIAFAPKLTEDQIEALMATHGILTLNNKKDPLLEILATAMTSEEAYTKLLAYFIAFKSKHYLHASTVLKTMISRLNQYHLQKLIAIVLPILMELKDSHKDVESRIIEALLVRLTPLLLHLNQEQEGVSGSIFETMVLILSSCPTRYLYDRALNTIIQLIPRLTLLQINRTFSILNSILDDNDAYMTHDIALQALTALVPKLTAMQVRTLFSKVVSKLGDRSHTSGTQALMLAMLIELLSKSELDDDQINILFDTIKTFDVIVAPELYSSYCMDQWQTIMALAPRLNKNQTTELFTAISLIGTHPANKLIKLQTLFELVYRLSLTQAQTNILLSEFFNVLATRSFSSLNPDHDKFLSKIATRLALELNLNHMDQARATSTFDQLIHTMRRNPSSYDETSTTSLAVSTISAAIVLKLTHSQIEQYLVIDNHFSEVETLLIFKVIASRLDDIHFGLVSERVIAMLDCGSEADEHKPYRLILHILANFAPRLSKDQAQQVCKHVISHYDYTPDEVLVLLHALLVANKIDSNTLSEAFELIEQTIGITEIQVSPYLLETKMMMSIICEVRSDLIQELQTACIVRCN